MENKLDSIQLYEIKTQMEYYLSDENLAKDHFFHEIISSDGNGYVDLDLFVKCNKIIKAKWTKDNLIEGIKSSSIIELDDILSKVRRKNNPPLPELKILNKKRKKETKTSNKEEEEEKTAFLSDPIILQITTDKEILTKWKDIIEEFKAQNEGLNVVYSRFKGIEGHFGILIPQEAELKFTDVFTLQGIEFKVKKCEGDDLIDFWKNHGLHYEFCTKEKKEKGFKKQHRKKGNKTKESKK